MFQVRISYWDPITDVSTLLLSKVKIFISLCVLYNSRHCFRTDIILPGKYNFVKNAECRICLMLLKDDTLKDSCFSRETVEVDHFVTVEFLL